MATKSGKRTRFFTAHRGVAPDNRLALLDQMSFLSVRATGQGSICQCVWVYQRPVDYDGLRRFHRNLGYGLLARRIERSPLPFARHRWVSDRDVPDIDIAERVRPRDELGAWADERGQLPVNPESGPSWHLGVAHFADGSTGITLVASHLVVDGLGFFEAIADAIRGNTRDLGYPPPRSRTRRRAVLVDGYQTVRDMPEVARAAITAARLGRRRRSDIARVRASRPVAVARSSADDDLKAPGITIHVDLGQWDTRANILGGNSNSLFAGFAAKLAERVGCRADNDGAVAISLPVSDRVPGDTRANALSFVIVSADPARVTADLSDLRGAIGQALQTLRETPEELLQVLALAPWTPRRVMRKLAEVAYGYTDVGCSAIGDMDPAVGRPDGTDAEQVFLRGGRQRLTQESFDRPRGVLVASGRIRGRIFITVIAHQLHDTASKDDLAEIAAQTLSEFGLNGTID